MSLDYSGSAPKACRMRGLRRWRAQETQGYWCSNHTHRIRPLAYSTVYTAVVHQAVSVPADRSASPDGCQPGCQQSRDQDACRADIGRISRSRHGLQSFLSRTYSCYCSSTTYTLLIIPASLLLECLPHHSF
jgi:hypothetical protein